MFKRGVFLFFLFVVVQMAKADIADTVIALEQVVTKGVKFDNYSMGAKLMPIDSFQLATNQMSSVAELFSQQSFVNVTTYGPGGHAGVKIRGGNADHTTIIWNGLNLKPPMSGDFNYSAVNSGVFDEIVIQPGGSSTMYGSGAATGVIFLSNKLSLTNKGFHAGAGAELGSFNSFGLNGKASFIGDNFGSRVFAGFQGSENNFTYKYGSDYKKVSHSTYDNVSIAQQNVFQLGANTKIETDFWYANLFKEIPSLKTNPEEGKTKQRDEHYYLAVNAAHYGSFWFLKYRGGYIDYNNIFHGYEAKDSSYYIAENASQTYINELESKLSINKLNKIFLGVNYTLDQVHSDTYTENATRGQLDFFGRYAGSFFKDRLKINVEGRQAITDGKPIPFVYSGGVNFEILKGVFVKALGSRLYSLPDLNDLYWSETAWASGNRNIKPEFGWSSEYGLRQEHIIGSLCIQNELTVYKSELTDAIVWLPDTNSKWVPQNVEGTLTKGVEFSGNISTSFSKANISFGYDYAYTDSKEIDAKNTDDEAVQRRYIPKHKGGTRIQFKYLDFSAGTYLQLVGERYIDDVSLPLKPYALLDIYLSYKFKIHNSMLNVYVKLKNILNTDYEVMAGYAQPGRSIYLGINYKF